MSRSRDRVPSSAPGGHLPRFIVYLEPVAFAAVILSVFLRLNGEKVGREQEMGAPETAVSFEAWEED